MKQQAEASINNETAGVVIETGCSDGVASSRPRLRADVQVTTTQYINNT
jgi:hypothetical protein